MARAQDVFPPPAEPPVLRAVRTATAPVVDGLLDDAAWGRATPARDFRQVEPTQGAPAAYPTEVRVVFDDRALYLAVRAHDPAGPSGVRVQDLRRDYDPEHNDGFTVALDPFGDGRAATSFQVTPYGAQRDQLVLDDLIEDTDWDAPWRVRTRRTRDGWTAELAIPWHTLRYPRPALGAGATAGGSANVGTTWRVNFARLARRANELSGWAAWPRAYSVHRMSYAGRLEGLEPPAPARNLRLVPYALGSSGTGAAPTTAPPAGAVPQPLPRTTLGRVGGDAKWAVTPDAALDLTVNTDFAQADVDRRVVNLTRFSVFFPERRQFFLENAALFAAGLGENGEPFFSRAIGLDATGRPVPIDAGARGTWRSPAGSAGALLVRQRGAAPLAPSSPGAPLDDEVVGQPASTFAVLRGVRNLGARHRMGAMAVTRVDDGGASRPTATNTVAVVDGLYRPDEETTVRGMLARSTTRGAGGGGGEGTFAFVEAWRATNRAEWGWTQVLIEPRYEARAGFVPRADLVATNPWAEFDLRPRWLPSAVRRLTPWAYTLVAHGASDRRFQEGVWAASPVAFELQSGAQFELAVQGNGQQLTSPFTPIPGVAVPAGRYDFWQLSGEARTDPSRRWGAELETTHGGWFDGRIAQVDAAVRVAPRPHLAAALRVLETRLAGVGSSAGGPGGRTRERLLVPELRLALDPRVQLTGIYQHDTAGRTGAWNARFTWEYRPLSYLFVVWNGARPLGSAVRDPRAVFAPRTGQLVVKLVHVGQW